MAATRVYSPVDQSYQSVNWQRPVNWRAGLNDGRVSWYLQQPRWQGGTVLRDVCGRYHGVLTNMDPPNDWVQPTRKNGWGELDYDGTNDCVIASPVAFRGPMTVSAWIFTDTVAAGTRAIIANCDVTGVTQDFTFEINRTAAKLSTVWGNAVILTGTASIAVSTWTHVAMTRSGSAGAWTVKFYINGKEDASTTTTTDPNGTGNIVIGRIGDLILFFFDGRLDDVSLWDRALSGGEMAELYEESLAFYPTLLNRWTDLGLWGAKSSGQILTPDPVTASWTVPAASISAGAVSLTPDPVTGAWTVPTPSLSLGALSLLADAIEGLWTVPTPTLDGGEPEGGSSGSGDWLIWLRRRRGRGRC